MSARAMGSRRTGKPARDEPETVRRGPRLPLALTGDRQLLSAIRRGDERAFEALYDRHSRALLSYCRHLLGSMPDAEDALQQTFASAYRALRSDGRDIEPRPWLFTIARNACLDQLRRRRDRPDMLDEAPSTTGLAEIVEQREELRQTLRSIAE